MVYFVHVCSVPFSGSGLEQSCDWLPLVPSIVVVTVAPTITAGPVCSTYEILQCKYSKQNVAWLPHAMLHAGMEEPFCKKHASINSQLIFGLFG